MYMCGKHLHVHVHVIHVCVCVCVCHSLTSIITFLLYSLNLTSFVLGMMSGSKPNDWQGKSLVPLEDMRGGPHIAR